MQHGTFEDRWVGRQLQILNKIERKFLAGMAYAAMTHDPEIFTAVVKWYMQAQLNKQSHTSSKEALSQAHRLHQVTLLPLLVAPPVLEP